MIIVFLCVMKKVFSNRYNIKCFYKGYILMYSRGGSNKKGINLYI